METNTLDQLESLFDSSNESKPSWEDSVVQDLKDVIYVLDNDKIEDIVYDGMDLRLYMEYKLQSFISTYKINNAESQGKLQSAMVGITGGKDTRSFLKDIADRVRKVEFTEDKEPSTGEQPHEIDPNLETPNTPTK